MPSATFIGPLAQADVPPSPPMVLPPDTPPAASDALQQLKSLLSRLSIAGYAGGPLYQSFLDVQGTGANARNEYGNLDTKRSPLTGGRLQYSVNPYLALALDGMRGSADITGQQGRHHDLGNIPYPTTFKALSPSVQGRYPTDYGTPYLGVGPLFLSSRQGTSNMGASPDSFDIGLHAYGGYETPDLLDRLRAFLEAKYLYSNQTGGDVQGQFNGPLQQMSVNGGVRYRFGESGR